MRFTPGWRRQNRVGRVRAGGYESLGCPQPPEADSERCDLRIGERRFGALDAQVPPGRRDVSPEARADRYDLYWQSRKQGQKEEDPHEATAGTGQGEQEE